MMRQAKNQASCTKQLAKEKILREIKCTTPVITQMITTRNNIIVDPKKVLVMWTEDESSDKPLKPKPDSQCSPALQLHKG